MSTKVHLVKAMVFPVVMYGYECWTIKLSTEKQMLWTVVLEKTLESPLDCKEIQPVHPKGYQSWVFIRRTNVEAETLAILCKELTHLKRPWFWEKLKAGGKGDDRGWDCWMASLTQWTSVWLNSGSWWWTGRPGVLKSTWSQRVRHDWVTEVNWTDEEESCWKRRKRNASSSSPYRHTRRQDCHSPHWLEGESRLWSKVPA